MSTEEILTLKGKNGEQKTKVITITEIDEIIRTTKDNDLLHDWSLEYMEYNGENAKLIFKSYESDIFFDYCFKGIVSCNMDIDMLLRWVYELEIEISDNIKFSVDGIGINLLANSITLQIRKPI